MEGKGGVKIREFVGEVKRAGGGGGGGGPGEVQGGRKWRAIVRS